MAAGHSPVLARSFNGSGDEMNAVGYRGSPEERFWRKVNKTETCWLWTAATDGHGYGVFGWADRKMKLAHRLSWEISNGKIQDGLCVLHRCDVPLCVNPHHLFLGTRGDNNRDRELKGRGNHARGENSGVSKLTEQKVKDIRAKYKTGDYTLRGLAAECGIDNSTAFDAISGNTWKSVK